MLSEDELNVESVQRPDLDRSVVVSRDELRMVVDDELVDATRAALVARQSLYQGAFADRVDKDDAIVSCRDNEIVLEI